MAFAITANFLLGTYQGSDSGGRPEPYPSPDRLYKACVAAAYNTFDFERQTDDRVLTDEQIKNALAWLEDNPPHSILLPRVIPPTSDAISYRDKGYLEKGKVKKSPDKASKAMSYCQNAVESLLLTWQWDENQEQAAKLKASLKGGAIRAFLYRASNEEGQRVLPLGAADANRSDSYDGRIKTGDVIVLDASVKMFTELSSEGEVVMLDLDGKSMAKDVYNACALGKMVRYYKEADGHDGIKTAFTQAYALANNIGDFTAEQQEQMNRDLQLICTSASEMSSDSFADANTFVLNRIMYEEDETGCKTWWVVVSLHTSDSGSESDQEILSAKAKEYELLLGGPHRQEEGHQDHVAARAEALARMVGLDDDMVENLRIAGEYHDEGKIDARFQTLLYQGRKPQGQRKFRAKSRFSSRAWEQQFRNQCQLRGWRHEQRSVAEFVLACETETELRQLPEYRRQLIERLIGTSHGHGRSTFEHGTDYLLPESGGASRAQAPALNNIADDLFESGGWEALIDRTNQRYGFWGVSYMEALLRAADITCSKEGL